MSILTFILNQNWNFHVYLLFLKFFDGSLLSKHVIDYKLLYVIKISAEGWTFNQYIQYANKQMFIFSMGFSSFEFLYEMLSIYVLLSCFILLLMIHISLLPKLIDSLFVVKFLPCLFCMVLWMILQPLASAYGLAKHRDGRWEWAIAPGVSPSPRYQHAAVSFLFVRLFSLSLCFWPSSLH